MSLKNIIIAPFSFSPYLSMDHLSSLSFFLLFLDKLHSKFELWSSSRRWHFQLEILFFSFFVHSWRVRHQFLRKYYRNISRYNFSKTYCFHCWDSWRRASEVPNRSSSRLLASSDSWPPWARLRTSDDSLSGKPSRRWTCFDGNSIGEMTSVHGGFL